MPSTGAVDIVYGQDKSPLGKLPRAKRKVPVMRFITVEMPDPGIEVPTPLLVKPRAERNKMRRKLLSIDPWQYARESSNPLQRLDVRAVLQSVKGHLTLLNGLMEESLKAVRHGSGWFPYQKLLAFKRRLKARRSWSLSDHLLYRYAHWAIGTVISAKRVLHSLGLTNPDLRDPRNLVEKQGYGETPGSRVFFAYGKEYNTTASQNVVLRDIGAYTDTLGIG